MSSDKRIEASRQNGRKGGVKTLEGKRRSSKNAEKFGFYSKHLPVLGTESQYFFDQFRTGFFKQYKPVGPAEVELVESLADYSWRIRRFRLTSTWLLDKKMVEQAEQNEIDHPNLDKGARVALAMEALLLQADGFDKLARYEARLERTRDRILRALARTQQDRLLENGARIAKQQNEPRTPAESTQAVAAPDDFPCENWTPLPFHPDDVPFDMPQPDCYVPPRAFQKARAA